MPASKLRSSTMKLFNVAFWLLVACARQALADLTAATDLEYDYIVVGSGAGGGPLACRYFLNCFLNCASIGSSAYEV